MACPRCTLARHSPHGQTPGPTTAAWQSIPPLLRSPPNSQSRPKRLPNSGTIRRNGAAGSPSVGTSRGSGAAGSPSVGTGSRSRDYWAGKGDFGRGVGLLGAVLARSSRGMWAVQPENSDPGGMDRPRRSGSPIQACHFGNSRSILSKPGGGSGQNSSGCDHPVILESQTDTGLSDPACMDGNFCTETAIQAGWIAKTGLPSPIHFGWKPKTALQAAGGQVVGQKSARRLRLPPLLGGVRSGRDRMRAVRLSSWDQPLRLRRQACLAAGRAGRWAGWGSG